MNPKGLVAAASMTSQGSTPIFRHAKASSLASAIFTLRNVFSRSFAVSATRGFDASNTVWVTCRYRLAASFVQAGVTPPTTFGILAGRYDLFPRAPPPGGEAQKKIPPATRT